MPAVRDYPTSSLGKGLVKMEDRKRPARDHGGDGGPPTKKQATANGTTNKSVDDMPWSQDLEVRSMHRPPLRADGPSDDRRSHIN